MSRPYEHIFNPRSDGVPEKDVTYSDNPTSSRGGPFSDNRHIPIGIASSYQGPIPNDRPFSDNRIFRRDGLPPDGKLPSSQAPSTDNRYLSDPRSPADLEPSTADREPPYSNASSIPSEPGFSNNLDFRYNPPPSPPPRIVYENPWQAREAPNRALWTGPPPPPPPRRIELDDDHDHRLDPMAREDVSRGPPT